MRHLPNVVRAAGLITGLAVAVLFASSWQVAASDDRLGAAVRITAAGRGELDVTPTGVIASAPALRAGGPALTGRVELRNVTAVPLTMAVRAQPAHADLDGKLRVQVRDGDLVLVDERLGELRAGAPLVLESGEARSLDVRVWVPAGATGYHGHAVDVSINPLLPEHD